MSLLRKQLKDVGYKGEFDLSSLVEACGDGFESLNNFGGGKWEVFGDSHFTSFNEEFQEQFIGDSPEEAVARLWLALNKK